MSIVYRHNILLEKMALYNFNNHTLKWFSSYLRGRSQYVIINTKKSVMTKVTSGVPQGSVLGPLMYTLYINKLSDVIKDPANCTDDSHEAHEELFGLNCTLCGEIPCYADDATIIYASNLRENNQVKMIKHLKDVSNFQSENLLAVNEDKTTIKQGYDKTETQSYHWTVSFSHCQRQSWQS